MTTPPPTAFMEEAAEVSCRMFNTIPGFTLGMSCMADEIIAQALSKCDAKARAEQRETVRKACLQNPEFDTHKDQLWLDGYLAAVECAVASLRNGGGDR